jgi:phosphoribosylamine--glycine ligase
MNVLVIGKGGREHALCWRLNQSQSVRELYCTLGNPGINQLAEPIMIEPNDVAGLARFAGDNAIDLAVVGPEDPLANGIVDEFERRGLKIFGPSRAAAQLETSKAFAKAVMVEAGVPTARYAVFEDAEAARRYVRERSHPMVVKVDGLALGKGVTVCAREEEALEAITDAMERAKFGAAGKRVLIEDRLEGEECSFFALSDGRNAIAFGLAQDHKAIFDGDRGPNTGGMGAYSPVPQFDAAMECRIMDEVVRPTVAAMRSRGIPFRGVLFANLMIDRGRINVLEFNVRFGDPECEALMMRFEGDLAQSLLACAEGRLDHGGFRLSVKSAVTVVLASGGYPGEYRKGIPIHGLDRIEGSEPSDLKVRWAMRKIRVKVFHAGTAMRDGNVVTDGGRVLAVTAMADRLDEAMAAAYQAADMINFEGMHMRRDIGRRALAHLGATAG